MQLADYQGRFKTAEVDRDDAGVLTIRVHSRGGPLVWGALPHGELAELFNAVASDRDNRAVVLTGTGRSFIELPETGADTLARGRTTVANWDRIIWEGNRLINQMLDIEVPMIAAVNGPVTVHSELALLCDIVLCRDDTVFADAAHFPNGLVPGDSMQVIWPLLLGINRGRYFLLTGQTIDAVEARQLGLVGEVLPAEQLLDRAQSLAADLAARNPVLVRNTRQVLTRILKRAMADDLHTGLALEAVASLSGREWEETTDQ